MQSNINIAQMNSDEILNMICSTRYLKKDMSLFISDIQNNKDSILYFTDDERVLTSGKVDCMLISLSSLYFPILFDGVDKKHLNLLTSFAAKINNNYLICIKYDDFINELNDYDFIKFAVYHELGHVNDHLKHTNNAGEIIADIHAFKQIGYTKEKYNKIYNMLFKLIINVRGYPDNFELQELYARAEYVKKVFES